MTIVLTDKAFHQLPVEKVVEFLGVNSSTGLSAAEVRCRQKEFGPNRITARWPFASKLATVHHVAGQPGPVRRQHETIMNDYPSIAWVLFGLTIIIVGLGLNPKVRRSWRWGRTSTSIPMSTAGAVAWMLAFVVLTATVFGWLPFPTIFLPLPVLFCVALHDSWRESQRKKASEPTASEGPH